MSGRALPLGTRPARGMAMGEEAKDHIEVAIVRWKNGESAEEPDVVSVEEPLEIFVDGGVRSGTDVLKMLALGAEAVLVGRPMAIGAVGGGREGVSSLLTQYANELRTAMLYTGCASLKEITPSILHMGR